MRSTSFVVGVVVCHEMSYLGSFSNTETSEFPTGIYIEGPFMCSQLVNMVKYDVSDEHMNKHLTAETV